MLPNHAPLVSSTLVFAHSSEITSAQITNSTPISHQIGNRGMADEERISAILKSPEIIYAVIATMLEISPIMIQIHFKINKPLKFLKNLPRNQPIKICLKIFSNFQNLQKIVKNLTEILALLRIRFV